jgi:hypothetical protein
MSRSKLINIVGLILVLVASLALAAAKLPGADQGGRPLGAELLGVNEVSGGDPDGSGWADVTINLGQSEVCWKIDYENLDPTTAAHIHRGLAGVNGPPVVNFSASIGGGCAEADQDLLKEILQNPSDFYVNVHTTVFPPGAIRGQLSK